MKVISIVEFAKILKINYSKVNYEVNRKFLKCIITNSRRNYLNIDKAKLVAEKLIIFSDEKIEEVKQKLDEY